MNPLLLNFSVNFIFVRKMIFLKFGSDLKNHMISFLVKFTKVLRRPK